MQPAVAKYIEICRNMLREINRNMQPTVAKFVEIDRNLIEIENWKLEIEGKRGVIEEIRRSNEEYKIR